MLWFSPVAGFFLSLALTPYVASLMRKAGIVGRDVHKLDRPEVPEMGGLALLIALPVALLPALGGALDVALLTFLLFGVVGVIDDLVALKQSHKVALSLLAALPAVTLPSHNVDVFGVEIGLGLLFPIMAVLFIAGSANLVNMLAGFNGLEVGTSAIVLAFIALMTGGEARLLALTGMAVALGLLWWNRYPARVFPGDTGTLSLGALIGLAAIIGGVEAYAVVLLVPHAVDFLLKTRVRFQGKARGGAKIREDGTLSPPPYTSFLGMIMRTGRLTERGLVFRVWFLEVLLGLLAYSLRLLL
ncbi:MraY family glycosyltransferase [Palaeococcus ferrophilus]|uniref:MraY family glycosyltransferase n=1 Tax=Palaeococcus ferrophilus TaxID=83868 RepID=UPI00064EBD7F|nr:glycosyltransferase 4 family protein [Palaeococcus ferrophilus]